MNGRIFIQRAIMVVIAVILFSRCVSARTILVDGFSGPELDTTTWKIHAPGVSYSFSSGLLSVTDVSDSASGPGLWHEGLIYAPLPIGVTSFHLEVECSYYAGGQNWLRIELLLSDSSQSAVIAIIKDNRSYILLQDMGGPYAEVLNPAYGPQVFEFDRANDSMTFSWNGTPLLTSANEDSITQLRLNFGRYNTEAFGTASIDSVLATTIGRVFVPGDVGTIQAAIESATNGDTVLIDDGIYHERIDFLGKGIVVGSNYLTDGDLTHIQTTIVDADTLVLGHSPSGSVVAFQNSEDSTSILIGLTIQNGTGTVGFDGGGGIYCLGSSPRIVHCVVRNNSAIRNGGGAYIAGGTPAFESCAFTTNTAMGAGGAICIEQESELGPLLDGCVFHQNVADTGGAIKSYLSALRIRNSTFVANHGLVDGGHIALEWTDTVTIENCILAYAGAGSSLYCMWDAPLDVNLTCTDIFGNSGGDWNGCIADQAASNGNFSLSPSFCDWSNGHLQINDASPCNSSNNSCGSLIGALGVGCNCNCSCHADPSCDGSTNIVDVINCLSRAFRGWSETVDSSCTPHFTTVDGRTDVNCSGSTDVVDVVKTVNVAFRGVSPAAEYCEPCSNLAQLNKER